MTSDENAEIARLRNALEELIKAAAFEVEMFTNGDELRAAIRAAQKVLNPKWKEPHEHATRRAAPRTRR